jgi:AraC family transcriptional regulator
MVINKTVYSDADKNAIRHSLVKKLDGDIGFKGLAVKYVASGEEVYHINGKKHVVREGAYILGNEFTQSQIQIHQIEPAQGICIDISSNIITEVADFHDVSKQDLKDFLLSDQLFVNQYNVKNTSLGYTLSEINKKIKSGAFKNDILQNELFYSLAESIITDQRFVFDHLRKMTFKKQSTNEDVFRMLLLAKEKIDANLKANWSLDQISSGIGLSKYHFIRVFKSTFGVSPYQYQKRKRLEQAKCDLQLGAPILDTAVLYSFPDVPTFSKAFKQLFGQNPSDFKKSNK